MKKIAIITMFYNNDNYGGIAQAFALKYYIDELGYKSELISYKKSPKPMFTISNDTTLKKIKNKTYKLLPKVTRKIANWLAELVYAKKLKDKLLLRKEAFKYSRQNIEHSQVYSEENITVLNKNFDYFISGSDQIWKPNVIQPAYVCQFALPEKKCLSYASSIAVTEYPEDYSKYMVKCLKKFSWISVREKSSKIYLEKILEKKVDVVVDPTLLLNESKWRKIESEKIIHEKYIFVYLLGQSKKQRKIIKKYAKENNLKIVFLPHIEGKIRACDIGFGDINLYDICLPDFLSLIDNAEIICTDSFHASVFSIIFSKEFYVFNRESLLKGGDTSSRVLTLLEDAGIPERFIVKENDLIKKNYQTIDYNYVNQTFIPFIEKSQQLLKKALIVN